MGTVGSPKSQPQIAQLITQLEACFIDGLEEIGPEAGARSLRLFDVWRQVSLRRIADLADGAETFFRNGRLLPACTLTRSTVETVATQYWVWKKLRAFTDASDLHSIHTLLMTVVFGRRDKGEDWPNKSMNVLTAIDHLDKQFAGFRSEYDRLSEYAHPGLAGGYGMYVRTEGDRLQSHFGQNPLRLEMDPWGRAELERALLVAVTFNGLLQEERPRIEALMRNHG
jgi:hypothetical protein